MDHYRWKHITLVFILAISGVEADECNNYVDLDDVSQRSPESVHDSTRPPLSDNDGFTEQWYRAGFSDIPTYQPDGNRCGTVYPFYMQGNYPAVGVTQTKKACVGDTTDPCYYHKDIEVKNCGEYRVYKLVPIGFNSAAYCFEFDNTGQVPTYVPPTAKVIFQNVTWETVRGTGFPELVFSCDFDLSGDTNLWYGVTWRVNTQTIKEEVVKSSNLSEAHLIETDFTDLGYRHGISIFCDVHARFSALGNSGNVVSSQAFFAGIKVYNPSVRMKESESGSVMFEPTVPFACVSGSDNCKLDVQMLNPSSVGQCSGGTVVTKSEKCRTSIKGIKNYSDQSWKSSYSFEILHSQSTKFDRTNYYTIPLTTSNANHTFWSDNRIADITVNIEYDDSVWRGKRCSAVIDPHMRTFDGSPGKYVLYLNEEANQQVQYENHPCNSDGASPYCVCSAAVQAGRNVFLIDICDGNKIIDFQLCEEETLRVESDGSSYYKITFPTGTEVLISVVTWHKSLHLNINIYPSAKDQGKTKGLCELLDGIREHVFTMPNGDVTADWETFAQEWTVSEEKDLLVPFSDAYDSLVEWGTDSLVCTCPFAKEGRPDGNAADCSYKEYSNSNNECRLTTRYSDFTCYVSILSRKKRDTLMLNKKRRNTHIGKTRKSHKEKRSVPNIMPEGEARLHCESAFNASASYYICMDSVQEVDDSYLNNCVLDLQMTGDTSLAKEQLQLFNDACLHFASKNVTLQQENTASVSLIYTTTCPSNCSNNGVCSEGVCICENGFAGSDCSNDISLPPTVTYLFNNGLCDVSEGSCDDIFVYGDDFYRTNLTKCQFLTQHVLTDNTYNREITVNDGIQQSLFEAVCNPPTNKDTTINVFVTMHNVSVSNDGSNYSDSLPLYIYDSTCQELQNESGVITFFLRDGFCFIDGQCIMDGTQQSSDTCLVCNRSESLFAWSEVTECGISTQLSTSTTIAHTASSTTIDRSTTPSTSRSSVETSSQKASSNESASPSRQSTISVTGSTIGNVVNNNQPKENNQTAIYVAVVLTSVAGIVVIVTMVIVVKGKCMKRKSKPESTRGIYYQNIKLGENRSSGYDANVKQLPIISKPPSVQTVSEEYRKRTDYTGPDISMFLAK